MYIDRSLKAYTRTDCRYVSVNIDDSEGIQKTLLEMISLYSNQEICIDVAGGEDHVLAIAAYICGQKNLTLIMHDSQNKHLLKMKNGIISPPIKINFSIDVGTAFELMGGELTRNGHVDPIYLDEDALELIPGVFQVYMKWRSEWPRFVNYLQHINTRDMYKVQGNTLLRRVPEGVYIGSKYVKVNQGILNDLSEAGAILNLKSSVGRYEFNYVNSLFMKLLADAGAWLEVYLYAILKASGRFDSIEINAVVSWDNDEDDDDVINEIDLVATSGLNRYFISCKTGVPTNDAVNEIGTIARRFGGLYGHPVLATTCDISLCAPAVLRRAREMGITVVDEKDVESNSVVEKILDT